MLTRILPKPISISGWPTRKEESSKRRKSQYQRALQIYPNYIEAHTNLGIIHFRQGMFDQALESIRRRSKLNPIMPKDITISGASIDNRRKWKEAIASFQNHWKSTPSMLALTIALGVIY